jgi:hypothetical protein
MIRFDLATMTPDLAVSALRDQKRANKAAEISASDVRPVLDIDCRPVPGMFEVRSQTRRSIWYKIKLPLQENEQVTCECMDWTNRAQECKHIKAAKQFAEQKSQGCEIPFNAETCQGCMLFQNCKSYAESKLAWAIRMDEARRSKQ